MKTVYDRLKALIEEYKKNQEDTFDAGTYWTYEKVIYDLESILYE